MSDSSEHRRKHLDSSDTERTRAVGETRKTREFEARCAELGPEPSGLARARAELERLERIAERDPLRHLRDFDPRRSRREEDLEIQLNPEGFLARHRGEGLDDATRRELCAALRERDLRHKRRDT